MTLPSESFKRMPFRSRSTRRLPQGSCTISHLPTWISKGCTTKVEPALTRYETDDSADSTRRSVYLLLSRSLDNYFRIGFWHLEPGWIVSPPLEFMSQRVLIEFYARFEIWDIEEHAINFPYQWQLHNAITYQLDSTENKIIAPNSEKKIFSCKLAGSIKSESDEISTQGR